MRTPKIKCTEYTKNYLNVHTEYKMNYLNVYTEYKKNYLRKNGAHKTFAN